MLTVRDNRDLGMEDQGINENTVQTHSPIYVLELHAYFFRDL